MARRLLFAALGIAAGFSGLALILSITTGVALAATLAVTAAAAAIVTLTAIRRADAAVVREARDVLAAGLVAGFLATLVYDATRTILSVLDPSPFYPFEALKHFGWGIVGPAVDATTATLVGVVVHVLNGTTFGMMYAALVGRRAIGARGALAAGIAWGVLLEVLQSILYPGWLRIDAVLREFLLISSAGHLAYGAVLGLGVRRILGRGPGGDAAEGH